VLHGSTEWSAGHAEAAPDTEAWLLPDAFSHAVAEWLPPASHLTAHRWRYKHSSDADDRRMLFDPEVGLAVWGDWPAGGRVGGKFLSGVGAADAICDSEGFKLGEPGA
jgi:predicted NAD/FAD-dependent oxidoreductase